MPRTDPAYLHGTRVDEVEPAAVGRHERDRRPTAHRRASRPARAIDARDRAAPPRTARCGTADARRRCVAGASGASSPSASAARTALGDRVAGSSARSTTSRASARAARPVRPRPRSASSGRPARAPIRADRPRSARGRCRRSVRPAAAAFALQRQSRARRAHAGRAGGRRPPCRRSRPRARAAAPSAARSGACCPAPRRRRRPTAGTGLRTCESPGTGRASCVIDRAGGVCGAGAEAVGRGHDAPRWEAARRGRTAAEDDVGRRRRRAGARRRSRRCGAAPKKLGDLAPRASVDADPQRRAARPAPCRGAGHVGQRLLARA